MKVEIENKSGFCFGVVNAIEKAEEELSEKKQLYCLGDIVHNNKEVERLKSLGLTTIGYESFEKLKNCTVLIRAHGEPPEIYKVAEKNNIRLIDATCPVVLKLQKKINKTYQYTCQKNEQIVIYGKEGHAEVNGLVGQTNGSAIVIGSDKEIDKINFSRPVNLFSQTTKLKEGYLGVKEIIKKRIKQAGNDPKVYFNGNDTTCKLVANRQTEIKRFAEKHDIIIFVSGKKSSNGRALFLYCQKVNKLTYWISGSEELHVDWFRGTKSVGVCGATSTPRWLMEQVADEIQNCAT